MRINIEFDADNAAFEGHHFYPEIRRIFDQAIKKIHAQRLRPPCSCTAPESVDKLLDTNGNTVGWVRVSGHEEGK